MNEHRGLGGRGQNELIGMVLLIGLVLTGSVTIVVLGASILSDAQAGTELESAELQLQELDSRLETLAAADAEPRAAFDTSEMVVRDFRIERRGSINVTVDRNTTCSFQQPLSTILYEDSQGRTVGYEAGGVWRGGPAGSTVVSPPSVTFQDGTLDVRLVNVTGTFDQGQNEALLNVTQTRNRSEFIGDALTRGTCVRPDNLTIRVDSRYTTGWRNYLQSEIGLPSGNLTTLPDGTLKVYLGQGYLHPSADDKLNQVINFREAPAPPPNRAVDIPYMDDAKLQEIQPVSVMADKGAGNTYSAFVEPLTDDTLGIGREINVEGINVSGPPIDVALVLDESGSMTWGGSPNKFENAQDGAQNFVATLNDSRDRASVVSYDDKARYRYVSETSGEMFFSSDFDAVNNSIDDGPSGGGTAIFRGMEYMNAVFDLKSNQTRRKVAILLTDGQNDLGSISTSDADAYTREAAEVASSRGITVYTIGYGTNADEGLMKKVANKTGGRYCFANNASAVEACFENFGDLIKPQNAIATTPITSNITTSTGQLFDADIPGDTSHIAQVTAGSEIFLNVNDPTAPSLFSHSFSVQDREESYFNLTEYDCKPGAWNLTGRTRTVNGTTLTVARCTDIGARNGTFTADIYLDGERPDTLLETTYAGWQADVNTSLDEFDAVNINDTTGVLEAGSNQALLVFDLPPQGPGTRNTLALLVQIGLSEKEAAGESIVDVRVAEAALR